MLFSSTPVLVVANSARMLTKLLVDNNFQVVAIDCYGDADTRHYSLDSFCIEKLEGDFFNNLLLQLREKYAINYVFYGTGFEQNEDSLHFLQEHFELVGNSYQLYSKLRNKADFFQLLEKHKLPHPQVCFDSSVPHESGLRKPCDSFGGIGLVFHQPQRTQSDNYYWQEYLEGHPCSVLFVANGFDYKIIGFNRQLVQEIDDQPFVFSGLIAQIEVPNVVRTKIKHSLELLVKHYELKGLCSLDFILSNAQCYILEINARVSASAQLYGSQVMQWHFSACNDGVLPEQICLPPKQAYKIIFSESEFSIPANVSWPNWVVDRPPEGRQISKNQPICSIIVDYESSDNVANLLQHYAHIVKNHLLSGS